MLDKKINLEEILESYRQKYLKEGMLFVDYQTGAMKEAIRQALKLAAEEAKVTYNSYIDLVDGCETYIVDKQSILNVINLIE